MDTLLLRVRDQVILRQQRVRLDLERGGNDASCLDDALDLLDCEVGHADGADLRLGQRDQGFPGVDEGGLEVERDVVLGVLGVGREEAVTRLEGDGPVDDWMGALSGRVKAEQ